MASENGSPKETKVDDEPKKVLNAGWRLRMVHDRQSVGTAAGCRVLNAGWRLRMVHLWKFVRMSIVRKCSTPDGV